MPADLKQQRARLLATLTRVRRRAFVMIDSRGSRTKLISVLSELDTALQAIENITDEYTATLDTQDDRAQAKKYCEDAESQHQEAVHRIEEYLQQRKNEPASVASGSQQVPSHVSSRSVASRHAEINAKVKQLETTQLERRMVQEKEEQDLHRQRMLQEAKDAQAAAELQMQLTRAAEDELNWERRNDFIGELGQQEAQGAHHQPQLNIPSQPVDVGPRRAGIAPSISGEDSVVQPRSGRESSSLFTRSLPRLTLQKFSGEPLEWPKWFALFKSLIHDQPSLSSTEKMAHLQSAVTGIAQRTIGGMLYDGNLYEDAVQALRDRFGREEDIVHANLKAVFECPAPAHLDPVGLERLHAAVHCAVTVFKKLGYDGDLSSFENLRRVVEKLPSELKRDWGEHVMDIEPERPNLTRFDTWLRKQVRVALNYAAVSQPPKKVSAEKKLPKPKYKDDRSPAAQRTALATEAESPARHTCICCDKLHEVTVCPVFQRKTVDERAQLVASARCCFFCLKKNHRVRDCRFAKPCGVDECKMRHHKMLHGSRRIAIRPSGSAAEKPQTEDRSPADRVVAAASRSRDDRGETLLQLVPVRIIGRGGTFRTVCALLDPGSQTSLCCEDVLAQLDIPGEDQLLRLQSVEGCGPAQRSKRFQLKVLPSGGGETPITVPEVFSVKEINVTVPHVQKKRADWKHLRDLKLPDCTGKVELLLGANVLEAVVQLEVRTGKPGQPVALRTAFGWTLTGSVTELVPGHLRSVMFVHHSAETAEERDLCTGLQAWWATESFGTKFEGGVSRSQEDARAQQIMDGTITKRADRYEVGLLWKQDNVAMPDNSKMAYQRLQSLERSLARDPTKAAAYREALMGYVAKEHARKVTPEELTEDCPKRWLLPHHAVINPAKPKARVVFDAAAQYAGTSLNSALLTGPDLLQNLVGVLARFREERVALVADIEQMFHQVGIIEADQPALSFLWRDLDKSKSPEVFQMMVVIFGAKCSPTLANFALRRTADDHHVDTEESRAAATAVVRHFYMDDFLKSEKDVSKAKSMRNEVTQLVAKGGFRLTKWMSNSHEVMEDISEEDRGSFGLDLSCIGQGTQRALGCVWRPGDDVLGVKTADMEVPATKRGVLSRVSMVFDPLGIVSPFILRAKLLVQRLWALKCGWDEQLSGEEKAAWEKWLSELPQLQDVEVPRCYKAALPGDGYVSRCELHIFCDASEDAFGAVAYLRMTNAEGTWVAAFVMSRTRLAPLRQLTIVRLELQAAVLGVRLASSIKRELTYTIDETYYWTDSRVVLQFLQNESRRFHTFVANRISEIHESSQTSEWRHVPGQLNPADVCSRGMSGLALKTCATWWTGPAFLTRGQEEWPSEEVKPALNTDDPEVKKPREAVFVTQVSHGQLVDSTKYSSWLKYKRTVGWIMRFIRNLKQRKSDGDRTGGPLTAPEIQSAEIFLLKESQRLTYAAELKAISGGAALPAESLLTPLSPFVDEQGLLRARGRLHNAPLPETARHPVIIGKDEDITRLIVFDAHQRIFHSGLEHTLSEVRVKFWMCKARSTTRKILHRCAVCRNRRACPRMPRMADLPDARFDTSRPFACVGIDYFGPLTVRKFRKTEKRYVLLITCLATRGIHLELASSMDTDCFLMALRRFIARRGTPRVIWSDNGSNLVAGEKEIRESLDDWNQSQLTDELSQRQIEWKFIPPTASHMGGIWERLVASVKRALRVVLGSQCVAEDVLQTVLSEVEFVINSRPLTYVSADINDLNPLTPNHFLLGQPESALPPGVFSDRDNMGRKRWRLAQVLSDHLWRRWQDEYLPSLMERKKWLLETRDLQVGDVVLMVHRDSPRGFWPLARITEVFPGVDGRVRSVQVRTSGGSTYRRPVSGICFIEQCPN